MFEYFRLYFTHFMWPDIKLHSMLDQIPLHSVSIASFVQHYFMPAINSIERQNTRSRKSSDERNEVPDSLLFKKDEIGVHITLARFAYYDILKAR